MIKKTFALTLSLSVSAQLAAQTETDYLSGMTPECRQNNPNIVFILLDDENDIFLIRCLYDTNKLRLLQYNPYPFS